MHFVMILKLKAYALYFRFIPVVLKGKFYLFLHINPKQTAVLPFAVMK